MRRICGILNTNSYEVVVLKDKDHTVSLRGIYPTGALQNHCCVPNTRHHFDDQQRLYVSAALPIAAGEELTMSYTNLLWDTSSRRQFLKITKHFLCNCNRCSDPSVRQFCTRILYQKISVWSDAELISFFFLLKEFGSRLGAIFCARDDCSGHLLPRNSLNRESSWICDKCQTSVTHRQVISESWNA